ncbi:23S rRNA (uracil(1939)-C(5))-methyltransferase RlmD [Enterococcus sp. 2201sp1_2201st1_B8_2201SCRN_220225]|uniref:23S rRNA (uracil(1939)-C(5))-methyltransferase RlmD n=1 Tax=unclassified Enterococcus TaxID=2608891 RepID=UPI0034A285C0
MSQVAAKIGQSLKIQVKRLGINGEGIGYYRRTIIFIPGALPKEEVQVKVTKTESRYLEGQLVKIIKASPERITPPCPFYDRCGGCQLQHLSYPAQLNFKKDLLAQALAKFKPKGWQNYRLLPTIGMEDPWRYRNKAQFQMGYNEQTKKAVAGLYERNSHQLVAIDNCLVQIPATQETLNVLVQLVNKYQTPIYNEKKHAGILKTLVVRVGQVTGELQVTFVTSTPKLPQKNAIIREITERLPKVVSIMQNVQKKQTSLVMGDETFHLWGKETIHEAVNELKFDLSARAFYQLNPKQTATLYKEAEKALDLKPTDRLVDAYCGVGTIGLSLAPKVKEVRGMDVIPEAITDAQKNAQNMGYDNTYYAVGTAEDLLPQWLVEGFRPDAILVDPPRTGLDEKLRQALLEYPVDKLVYISCNVSTLARDLATLSAVYQVDYLQSVDMFPQTARCEVVVKLTRS